MPPTSSDPLALVESSLAAVRDEFRTKASTLEFKFWRSTEGLDAPRIDVWFTVATDSDLAMAQGHGLQSQLDEAARMALARNGYLRQTGDVVIVSLWSRDALERGAWR